MARIQILELPMLVNGDAARQPFALIIDQVRPETGTLTTNQGETIVPVDGVEFLQGDAERFAESIGAQGVLMTTITLDVA